ncbi:KTSC domain-containing protein [Rhizobiales bacterium RZME27]|uniref:KTSC domain-containing protein n=1 Tax=Endobacterium cereale TaxID=2663029 RepID=A0A6A8A2K5_9HYPH|nr:KTSC domain-containing protein [Endobacterium cereale]MEB2844987.1 KTSC domain-containing protein [Endobacterium cereale]MQY44899.1 KTSC domain-containing protein [Endobacterium cereale]
MHRIAVSSRLIAEIAYDPDLKYLDVTFQDGVVRQLADVPTETVSGLLTATSPGNYYMTYIRKVFPRRDGTTVSQNARTA